MSATSLGVTNPYRPTTGASVLYNHVPAAMTTCGGACGGGRVMETNRVPSGGRLRPLNEAMLTRVDFEPAENTAPEAPGS